MSHHRVALYFTLVVAALAVVAVGVSGAWAENKIVVPARTWKGSIDDREVRREAGDCIAHQKTLEKLWKVWAVPGPIPTIDFDNEIVLVITGSGSMVQFESIILNDFGNLQVNAVESLDVVPGFRYVIATVSREGVKSVNGKEVPKVPIVIADR